MRPIPTASTTAAIREAYFTVKIDSQDPHDVNLRAALLKNHSGSAAVGVALDIRPSRRFGRGLFSRNAIASGQPVYEATRYGLFGTEAQWRCFLELLPSDELRYDAVLWSYVPNWAPDLSLVALDLDEGSLMNHGVLVLTTPATTPGEAAADESTLSSSAAAASHGIHVLCPGDTANVRYCGETQCYVATRDIKVDEEILCDYSTFHAADNSLTWYSETWNEIVGIDPGTKTSAAFDE